VKREVWRDVGGYPDWYKGFGGEEASFDLMCWAQGMRCGATRTPVHTTTPRELRREGMRKLSKAKTTRALLKELEPHLPRLKEMFSRNDSHERESHVNPT
jgi:hypothetical protein